MTYANPKAVIAISVIFPVLGFIAVSLRFYSRLKANMRLRIDDWLFLPALFLEVVLAGMLIWGAASHSLGETLPPPDKPGPQGYLSSDSAQQIRLQQIQYYFDFIGVFTLGLLKLSLLFFYRKIFCAVGLDQTVFAYIVWGMIGLTIAWTLTFGIGAILLCGTRPGLAWAPVIIVAEKCSAQLPFLEGYAISDFIMDVLIWTLPIPRIMALHMTTRRKVAVASVFGVGLLTIAASAARMGIYIKFVVNAFAQSDGETLITYLLFWSFIEIGLAVIVVCLPTLRSLYAGKKSLGSILSGIKSAFSIRSLQSRSFSTDRTRNSSIPLESVDEPNRTYSGQAQKLRGKSEGRMQAYIVGGADLQTRDLLDTQDLEHDHDLEMAANGPHQMHTRA